MTSTQFTRVIYKKNPITEVICQVRFPRILRISSELPVSFQEKIQNDFPVYEEVQTLNLPSEVPPEVASLILADMNAKDKRQHEFYSRENDWKVTLNGEYLALTCYRYDRWENFLSRFESVFNALVSSYNLPFLLRLGLRYQNFINPTKLATEADWKNLIQDWMIGPYSNSELGSHVLGSGGKFSLSYAEQEFFVNCRHGIAQEEINNGTKQQGYLIDSDFYFNQTETQDVTKKLKLLNAESGKLFRLCIKDKLHMAMDPQSI